MLTVTGYIFEKSTLRVDTYLIRYTNNKSAPVCQYLFTLQGQCIYLTTAHVKNTILQPR